MENKKIDRFEVLRTLASAATKDADLTQASQTALAMAAQYVGLNAAALFLWDKNAEVKVTASFADAPLFQQRLAQLEKSLFTQLRKENQLVSAYLSFGGDKPYHSFTLPLLQKSHIFGAVIGLQEGERTIIAEDDFLEALSALLSLTYAAHGQGAEPAVGRDLLDKERLSAIVETAVTVNHEINNPLTAILGNVQLLLLKRDDLDDELKNKLKTIEQSAMKIRDVTQRLMRMTVARSVEYNNGTKMVDISDDSDE